MVKTSKQTIRLRATRKSSPGGKIIISRAQMRQKKEKWVKPYEIAISSYIDCCRNLEEKEARLRNDITFFHRYIGDLYNEIQGLHDEIAQRSAE